MWHYSVGKQGENLLPDIIETMSNNPDGNSEMQGRRSSFGIGGSYLFFCFFKFLQILKASACFQPVEKDILEELEQKMLNLCLLCCFSPRVFYALVL